ncbi:N-acetylmuramoyl-L-alanine amidase [Micromonospora sp. LAH09]|uniref:N-acetylmuramoyl-L-alanine amidase n=1 Tax=Micromonospora cabrerizensis TaxID=2911213 RepID=UPI001EE80632|nr:N-acetylmuramoyl-L-alanine amidase [Micromonospora cabrerizensis]MCG5471698.1 N-acetylmuramoyl-L-alanine amidase [Micromonospora cabrerizensis]
MRLTRRRCALVLVAVLAGQVATAPADAAPPVPPGTLAADFARAATEFDVPRDLLVAVGYGESRLDGHSGLPSQANGFGVMHLVSNPTQHSLERAATLTGEPVDRLRSVTSVNIRGGAAVLRDLADREGLTAAARDRLSAWYPVVAGYSAAADGSTARLYADHVYDLLRTGIATAAVRVAAQPVRPDLGRYASISPAGVGPHAAAAALPEYGPARWISAYGGNYQAGRSSRITTVVVHVTQGSYAGTVSWFQNPSAGVSAHYVVKSSNGEITQMVREGDTAYHARSANPYAVGIEHEGFVDNPAWFTDAMYRSSAALTRYLCDKYGLPKTRAAIRGHNEMPGNDHTDPGPNWNWNYYISLVNAGGGSGGRYLAGSPTDFTGDGRDDVVSFTQGSLNDVYVATSTGTAFAGTSVKWNDFFGLNGETLLSGDVNGDGRDDVVAFTHGTLADVYVALSTGTSFGGGLKWHDWFAPGAEVGAVGDVNGDGRDDIIAFTHDTNADVYVALSTGTGFGPGLKWHEYFSIPGEFPALGDVNGDGRDDIITFTQGPLTASDVIVSLSAGSGFGAPQTWHDLFAVGTEQPRVGDINGDGRDDIVTFTCNADADVYAATSTGTGFAGTTVKWNDYFCLAGEFPYLADANGDGRDDIVVFTKGSTNDIHVSLSTGTGFLGATKWHDFFGLNGETTL